MKDSIVYQWNYADGFKEGAVAELKKIVRQLGDHAFGPPDSRTAAAIERMDDLPRLEEMLQRVRTANSWPELLGRPSTARRGGRRLAP